ncbi:hypothetical protein [Robiginitalea sediminis]|uniref:hypothetical protein n=1 Tax=Robiginitalea sediminis TaxID=1982593 RepID=UPI000B4BE00A|nr:hypothetical protein [Robiginitalea sediminis]
MKHVIVVLTLCLSAWQVCAKEQVVLPAGKAVELTYEEFATYDVKLVNRSGKPIDVAVLTPDTRKQVSGFGLGPMGKAVLYVKAGNILKLKNNSGKDISIALSFVDRQPQPERTPGMETVNFTLHNSSLKSIPLVIPGVMNPNLSPMSNSGVALAKGQEIYYRKGLKKILVLTVDDSIEPGAKIDMAKRIRDLEKGN